MTKRTLGTVAKYLLAIGVLAYVIHASWEPAGGHGLGNVWQRHIVDGHPIQGTYLLLGFAVHVIGLAIALLRWYLLVRAQDLPFTILAAFRLGTLGFLCSAFLPGSVGGDVIKAAALAREQDRRTIAVATVIMDRVMSLLGLLFLLALVGGVCWTFGLLHEASLGPARPVIASALVSIGVTGAVWLAMGLLSQQRAEQLAGMLGRTPKIGGSLAQLWQAACLYRNRPASVAWALVLSAVSTACECLVFYLYASALWVGLPNNPIPGLTEHLLLVPVGLVISAIPLFPGGAGIGEAGFGGLYSLFGSAAANGVLGSLLFRMSGWLIGILGYLICQAISPTVQEVPVTNGTSCGAARSTLD